MRRQMVSVATFLFAFGCMFCLAADPTAWTLKTPAPDAAKFRPFLDGVASLRSDLESVPKIPADAASRFSMVKSQSSSFLQQSQLLASALKQNNETKAFDALVVERLRKSGATESLAEIQKVGGPFALLSNSKAAVDKELAEITSKMNVTAPGAAAEILLNGFFQLVETQNAEAAIRIRCNALLTMYYVALGVDPSFCGLH